MAKSEQVKKRASSKDVAVSEFMCWLKDEVENEIVEKGESVRLLSIVHEIEYFISQYGS